MKPVDILGDLLTRYYIKISGGYNCSLLRLSESDCVIAYRKENGILRKTCYIILRNSKEYKFYIVNKLWNEELKGIEINEGCGKTAFLKQNLKIVDKEEFENCKNSIIVEAL